MADDLLVATDYDPTRKKQDSYWQTASAHIHVSGNRFRTVGADLPARPKGGANEIAVAFTALSFPPDARPAKPPKNPKKAWNFDKNCAI